MPNRAQWDDDYRTGDATLDEQHRDLLAQCNALADFLSGSTAEDDAQFQVLFDGLMASAREHFAAEAALLSRCGYDMLDELTHEHEEFSFLADEIVTTENFDKLELQHFLLLWWVGHLTSAGRNFRPCLEKQPSS